MKWKRNWRRVASPNHTAPATPTPSLSIEGWIYYVFVILAGALALGWAVSDLAASLSLLDKSAAALLFLTILSVFATIKIPSTPATLSVAETFLFMILLLYGAGAGAIAVAVEALVVWWRKLKEESVGFKLLFTLCSNSLAMVVGGLVFFRLFDMRPLAADPESREIARLALPTTALALVYFSVSSWLVAIAIAFERKVSAINVWRENFAWLVLNYVGAASLGLLFVLYLPLASPAALIVIAPPLLVLYFAYANTIRRVEDTRQHLESLNALYLATIETLATAIDAKDQVTHGHIRRVQQYAVALAGTLGIEDETQVRAVEAASLLHDMGKLAVPDYILNKPGPLTQAEFERMKTHASVGADILASIQFPYPVVPIVRHHHENWDGTGYPDGLKGEAIPIGARILSVVDCYDALTSDRPYRPKLSDEAAMAIVRERAGTMYDPTVVSRFEELRRRFAVEEPAPPPRGGPIHAITQAAARAQETPAQIRLDEISASSEEMLTLYEIARAVNGPLSVDDAAEIVGRHLRRLIPSTYCVFYAYDAAADELAVAHASGDPARVFADLRIPMGQRLTGWVGANRQTIVNSDPVLDLGEAARAIRPPLRSALSTPLVVDGALTGVLTLYSTVSGAFDENHRRIIEAVSRQVSGTIRSALRFDEHKRSSFRDELTGLPSLDRLRNMTAGLGAVGGQRNDGGAIILVDVDRLGAINERAGRAAGDEVLARVAAAIRGGLGAGELLFRSAGDEFVVLLSTSERAQAHRRAAALRHAVHAAHIANPLEGTAMSVSVAIAFVPEDGTSVDMVVAAAQQRLTRSIRSPLRQDPDSIH